MKKHLMLMGAFDRYNYGDLLFPIFMQEYIEKHRPDVKEYYSKIIPVSLEEKNFTDVGGLSTMAWKKMSPETPKDIVVVGGDVLGASIEQMYMDSLSSFFELFVARVLRKLTSNKYIEKESRKKFKLQNAFPYVPIQFKDNIEKVAYNSVSGSGFIRNDFQNETKNTLLKRLSNSHYVSVRDERTLESLKNGGIDAVLAPDSASIMAELYPLSQLEQKISSVKIKELKNESYIVFQFGYWHVREKIDDIVYQIENITSESDAKIVLLPVGFATNHDDIIALKQISKKLKVEHILLEDISIWDIMYVIGNAKFFFGTSLHGNITAMAYGIPHIGICKRIVKLDKYLSTWGVEPFNKNIEIEEISSFYMNYKDVNLIYLQNNSQKLVALVHDNYNLLFDCLITTQTVSLK